MRLSTVSFLILFLGLSLSVDAQPEGMVSIEQGTYMPFYSSSGDSVEVPSFHLDKHPVTNAEFLEFVRENEEWRRSEVKSVFTDEDYLRHWEGALELGDINPNAPVTNVPMPSGKESDFLRWMNGNMWLQLVQQSRWPVGTRILCKKF
jgi:formylglycine-generating enzyme required for sulfatase activity